MSTVFIAQVILLRTYFEHAMQNKEWSHRGSINPSLLFPEKY